MMVFSMVLACCSATMARSYMKGSLDLGSRMGRALSITSKSRRKWRLSIQMVCYCGISKSSSSMRDPGG